MVLLNNEKLFAKNPPVQPAAAQSVEMQSVEMQPVEIPPAAVSPLAALSAAPPAPAYPLDSCLLEGSLAPPRPFMGKSLLRHAGYSGQCARSLSDVFYLIDRLGGVTSDKIITKRLTEASAFLNRLHSGTIRSTLVSVDMGHGCTAAMEIWEERDKKGRYRVVPKPNPDGSIPDEPRPHENLDEQRRELARARKKRGGWQR